MQVRRTSTNDETIQEVQRGKGLNGEGEELSSRQSNTVSYHTYDT